MLFLDHVIHEVHKHVSYVVVVQCLSVDEPQVG